MAGQHDMSLVNIDGQYEPLVLRGDQDENLLEPDLKLFSFIPFLRNISPFTTAIGVIQCYTNVFICV